MALAGAVLLALAPSNPVAAAGPKTEAQQIIRIAKNHVADPWRYGATGPSASDCSGLVIYAFRAAGDRAAVGNGRFRTARALYRWYASRGLVSRSNPKPGDLVVWGGGSHIGIYIGNGMAISTLTNGVRVHGVHAVRAAFTAYLHTRMSTRLASGGQVNVARAATTSVPTRRLKTAITNVNLRTAATTRSHRITVVPRGRTVSVLGVAHDAHGRLWLHVRTAGRTGWVAGWYMR